MLSLTLQQIKKVINGVKSYRKLIKMVMVLLIFMSSSNNIMGGLMTGKFDRLSSLCSEEVREKLREEYITLETQRTNY